MATTSIETATRGSRTDRYRAAERALWARHGIEPVERFVEIEEPRCRLRVVEIGTGTPIVFVPGTMVAGPIWGGLVRELVGYRCLLVDRPGEGLSSPIDYRAGDYGATVAAVMEGLFDALGLDRAVVVGSSIGNVWALRAAQALPLRVTAVGLLGGGPIVEAVETPGFIRVLASPIGSIIVRLPMSPDRARSMLRDSGHGASLDAGRIPPEVPAWIAAFQRHTDSMRHERAMVRTLVGRTGWTSGLTFDDDELAAIDQRLEWVLGDRDPVGSVDLWTRVATLIGRASITILEGAGHLPWLDDPIAVAAAIRRLMKAERT